MGEEKVKGKSVLSTKEIDFAAGLIDSERDTTLLEEQRKLLMERRLLEIWDAWVNKRWEQVLDAIKKIPEHIDLNSLMMANFSGKPYVGSIARVSLMMLLKNATTHLTTGQVELVGQVLMKMYSDGLGLGNEPWKTLFFDNAKKSLPLNAMEMIKVVEKAGIDGQEYVKVLRYTIVQVVHNADQEALANSIFKHKNFLSYISDFYGVSNLDAEMRARLLKAGDILLGRWYRAYGPLYLERACEIYKYLDKKVMTINQRMDIAEIRDRYCAKGFTSSFCGEINEAISVKLVEMRIRRIIREIAKEFDIKIM